jgi:hypothetical protein
MKRHWIAKAPKFILMAILGVALLGLVVMSLWNSLMPALFGWHTVTFWQAIGLLLLCKILFGGFRGRPGPYRGWRGRMRERWESMTPEQREKFRQGMQSRCGSFREPTPDARV